MSIVQTLTNPWVLGAGAAIGVIFLLSSRGDGGGEGNAYYSPAFLTEQARSQAALSQTAMQVGASLEGARIEANVTRDIAAMSSMVALANTSAVLQAKESETRNATIRAFATTNAAVAIDRQQNFTRLGMTYIQSSTAKYQADTQLAISRVQAKAMKQQGMYNLIGDALNAGTKVAAMALGVPPV